MDKLAVIDSLFGVPRALIGVVHLWALPGTPAGKLENADTYCNLRRAGPPAAKQRE